ncbi:MAG: 3-isopropylmalate dehydratase small subunit [Rhodospirillaceae bacterium]|nr:MAG: 3-isopropylmalate dehydratase small subunit [Rhodospirillaceae bacterium]
MQKFSVLKGVAAPLPMTNVDTDMIIPKQFLKTIKRTGLGKSLFFDMRYDDSGAERPEFVLNKAPYRHAAILIAGANFGCGSSREHAPWALEDFGLRCVIAPSFADIFYNNCFKNGMLCVTLPQAEIDALLAKAGTGNTAGAEFAVDLVNQTITAPDGTVTSFDIDVTRKQNLIEGLDDIGLTLKQSDKIAAFEARQKAEQPWLYAAS